ncbi:fungal-specific transcription factor domain-containing protein [Apodospora peruviana]|uniref:Fungal-specific transcription factor domain-containing protein n=1 Tax=Apodospora peruviana TaxID=516989 RepID=A0AAE0LZY2_9PEZI|nr:fungal-specific transcription factor domain-containing protein [Apodospora peruviana]
MNKRSRRGCSGCLQHHRKCDEAQPKCGRCSRLGVECDYRRALRWFNGTRLARTPRRGRDVSSGTDRRPGPSHIAASTGPQAAEAAAEGQLPQSPEQQTHSILSPDSNQQHPEQEPTPADSDTVATDTLEAPSSELLESRDEEGDVGEDDDIEEVSNRSTDSNSVYESPPSPDMGLIPHKALLYQHDNNEDLDDPSSLSFSSQDVSTSWSIHGPFDSDLRSMIFQDGGRYIAYVYFVRSVSLILPGFSGIRNGYRQLAASALSCPMLLDTVVSIATVYMQLRGIVPASLALQRQSQALASLRRNVNALSTPFTTTPSPDDAETICLKRDVLATILLQITVEIANGTNAIQIHIAHALDLFRELGYDRGRPMSPIGQILLQRMTYIDVLSSIFWHRRPLLPVSFWFYHQHEQNNALTYKPDEGIPTFHETTGCPLWVIAFLARISHLIADADEHILPNDVIISLAYQLDGDFTMAARTYYSTTKPPPDHPQEGYLETVGQCYYWSAIILLQIRVFRDPQTSHRVQFCLQQLLDLIQSLPIGCGPDSQLSLPLYAAALAAIRPVDRAAIKTKSVDLSDHYPMKTRTALTATFASIWADMDEKLFGPGRQGQYRVGDGGRQEGEERMQVGRVRDLMKEGCLFIC